MPGAAAQLRYLASDKRKANERRYIRKYRRTEKGRASLKRQRVQRVRRTKILLKAERCRPCKDCNRTFPWFAMDFYHRPGTVKVREVTRMLNASETSVRAEIAKCDVVCANCHRVRTFERAGWYE